MAAHHKNGPSAFQNRRSDNTTSGTSGSTESEMHGSYNWWGNDPPLPEVDMTALLTMRCSEESNANELKQRIRDLEAQIIECNKSKNMARFLHTDREVRIFYKRVNILCRQRIWLIKGLWWRFYVSRCGPAPNCCQRIGLNGGRKKIACARWYWKKYLYQWGHWWKDVLGFYAVKHDKWKVLLTQVQFQARNIRAISRWDMSWVW